MTAARSLPTAVIAIVFNSLALVPADADEPAAARIATLPAIAELPDPFLRADGTRIAAPEDWPGQRRRLLELVLKYEYGELPPPGDPVAATTVAARTLEGGATETELTLAMGPRQAVRTRLFLSAPAGAGPFPAIVTGDLGWARVKPEIVSAVVARGYILAEFSRVDVAPDSAELAGVYAAWPDYRGGRLAVWAWGYHRVIDYLCTLPAVDRGRIAVTGHSRGGKTALLAGATDERIALTAPNNSGCGGAGCYRLRAEKSEDIAAILKNFPFWFEPAFGDFTGHIKRLPFDQHSVKALVAPRALLSTEALGDLWANPYGSQQTFLAAREVYRFLGAADRIGIVFRPGRHEQNADDWQVLLDFADWHLAGRPPVRDFSHLAFPAQPAAYSWHAPAP